MKLIELLKRLYHYCLAWLGSVIYGRPSQKLFVIGVTGTKGKSTTVELINAILEAAGKKTALISSLRFKAGDQTVKNTSSMTMPGRFFIQRWLAKAVKAGCQYAILEVTSQGILQHRHRFIDFDLVAVTNLQPEHLEAHGSFEKYREAKVDLFRYVARRSHKPRRLFVINDEDASKEYFVGAVGGAGEIIYFRRDEFIEKDLNHGQVSIGNWLASQFNLENAAAAAAVAKALGIGWTTIQKALRAFKGVPGRMEVVQENPFRAVIDYAHTPDSLQKIYQALTKTKAKEGRLICVLGSAGGGRDKWKRAAMGKIAAQYCKKIILTNEDPYDESPRQIMDDLKAGIASGNFPGLDAQIILDRREAIQGAVGAAEKGDTVIVTGKGSESWLHLSGGRKIPWDDRMVVEEALRQPK